MAVINREPNGTINPGVGIILAGGAADLDDALHPEPSGEPYARLGFGSDAGLYGSGAVNLQDITGLIPPGAVIKQVRLRGEMINVSAITDGDGSFCVGSLWLNTYTFVGWGFWGQNQIIDYGHSVIVSGPWITRQPNGQPWTVAAVNALSARVGLRSPNTATGDEYAHLYAVWLDVEYNEAPTVDVTSPAPGNLDVAAPLIQWTYSDTESDQQESFEVKFYNPATVALSGFSPDWAVPQYESGRVYDTNAREWQAPALPNGVWRVAFRAFQQPVGGQSLASTWEQFDITVVALPIARPTVVTVPPPYSTDGSVFVEVLGGQNLLSLEDSAFEIATGAWGLIPGTTGAYLVHEPATVHNGNGSLYVAVVSAGTVTAFSGASAKSVNAYQPYETSVWVRSPVDVTVYLTTYFQTAGNTNVLTITDVTGKFIPANTWTLLRSGILFAPPTAVQARVAVTWAPTSGAGGLYIDEASVRPGQVRLATYDPLNDSFFENDAHNWHAMTNAYEPVAQAVTVFAGTKSAQMRSIAAGTMRSVLYGPDTGIAVDTYGGRTWTMGVILRGTAGRPVYLGYQAYDKAGKFISQSDGAQLGTLGTPNSTWNGYYRTFTVPANAAAIYPYVMVTNMGANESVYADWFTIYEKVNDLTEWGRGGLWATGDAFPDDLVYEVQASYDNGVTWEAMPHVTSWYPPSDLHVDGNQLGATTDFAVPPNKPSKWRARAIADVVGGQAFSEWGYSESVTLPFTGASLKDPWTATVLPIKLIEPFGRSKVEPSQVNYPLGRSAAVVTTEGTKGHTFDFACETQSAADREALEAMLEVGRALILTNTIGERWWIKVLDGTRMDLVKAGPEGGSPYGIRDLYRFSVRAVETVPPET